MNRSPKFSSVLDQSDPAGYPFTDRSRSRGSQPPSPAPSGRPSPPRSRHILIATDAWHPQVNGVVVTLSNLKHQFERRGDRVSVIHPGLFRNVPLPFYPEIRISLLTRGLFASTFSRLQPDYVHIATEGPLGLTARFFCTHRALNFTASFHTHFQLYTVRWFPSLLAPVHSYLRLFHRRASRTMVATPGLQETLGNHGFSNLAIWPLGVDAGLFVRNPSPPIPSFPKPVFTYFGRLSPEKSPEQFL